jgi:hypothetical protein
MCICDKITTKIPVNDISNPVRNKIEISQGYLAEISSKLPLKKSPHNINTMGTDD